MAEKKQSKPARNAKHSAIGGKVEELVEEISALSVLELSDLVNELQDKLGVTAAMPVAAAEAGGAPVPEGGTQAQAGGGGANQTVVMTNAGGNKIAVIKALREINQNLTLIDAKNMTEAVPAEVLKDAKAEDAKSASEKLKAAGATLELK